MISQIYPFSNLTSWVLPHQQLCFCSRTLYHSFLPAVERFSIEKTGPTVSLSLNVKDAGRVASSSHTVVPDLKATMELPSIGEHCSEPTCRKLDFLPVRCDACEQLFCMNHMRYTDHACPSAFKKDIQVPVCPLCNSPVMAKRGEQPDIAVGAHIDNNCKSDTAKTRRKVFANRCSRKGCKTKEMIPINCSECLLNFCLKHRNPFDHECGGKAAGVRRKAAEAAEARQSGPKTSKNNSSSMKTLKDVQGNMNEDEALARALAASMQESSTSGYMEDNSDLSAQEAADLALARALAESEQMYQTSQRAQAAGGSRDKCILS